MKQVLASGAVLLLFVAACTGGSTPATIPGASDTTPSAGELWEFQMTGGDESELGEVARTWRGRFRVDAGELEGQPQVVGKLEGVGEVEVSGSVLCLDTETDIPFSGTIPFDIAGVATETELVVHLRHGAPTIAYTEEVPGLCADPDSIAYMDDFDIWQLAYEDLEGFDLVYLEALAFPRSGGEKTITSLSGEELYAEIVRIGDQP